MGIDRIGQALDEIRLVVAGMMQDSAAGNEELLELARAVDLVERTGHGLLLRVLARVDQAKAAPAGVGPWLTSELGYQPGRGRAIAQDARRIGDLPVLVEKLASGHLNAGQTRVLARAEHAVKGTDQDAAQAVAETLTILETAGIQQAGDHVRALEHTVDPGRAETLQARQRSRSFARVSELAEGMCRFDLLLDAERATLVRTALDMQVAAFLRARQFDQTDQVPDDVRTTEHLTAEAFTRLAEVFLNATEDKRAEPYCPTVVYYAPAAQEPKEPKEPKQNPASASTTESTQPTHPTPHPLPPGILLANSPGRLVRAGAGLG